MVMYILVKCVIKNLEIDWKMLTYGSISRKERVILSERKLIISQLLMKNPLKNKKLSEM